MNRTLPLLLIAGLAPTSAFAGVGTSYGVGLELANFGFETTGSVAHTFPSLDLRFDPVLVQLFPLELVWNLANENIVLAGSVIFTTVVEEPLGADWNAVVQPGAHLAVADFGGLQLQISGLTRVGVESGSSASVGAYIVPSLGFAFANDELGLVAGGRLEMSVWF